MNSNDPTRALEPRSLALLQLVRKVLSFRLQGRLLIQAGDLGFASAPSNIALLKYWGKSSSTLQLPVSSSISRNLDAFRSKTEVRSLSRFFPVPEERMLAHRLHLNKVPDKLVGKQGEGLLPEKMTRFVDLFFRDWAPEIAVEIISENNFPTGCGVASSASGYAALAGALTHMAGIDQLLDENELQLWLSEWARLGSGSATRSAIMTPRRSAFVAWRLNLDVSQAVDASQSSQPSVKPPITETFEIEIHPDFQKFRHLLFVVSDKEKATSSSEGHDGAASSLFQRLRVAGMPQRFRVMQAALESGDFETIRILTEEDALSMHAVMATSAVPLQYISDTTAWVVSEFLAAREKRRWNALWTLDAGPNVHFLVEDRDSVDFVQFLETLAYAQSGQNNLRVLCGDNVEEQPSVALEHSLDPTRSVGHYGLILGHEKNRVEKAKSKN